MKYDCDVIKDLIPLKIDDIASEATNKIIDIHLSGCSKCRDFYEEMSINSNVYNHQTTSETEIVGYAERIRKKRKQNIIIIIASTIGAFILYTLLIFGLVGLFEFFGSTYDTDDITEYRNFNDHVDYEEDGMFSYLLIFPTEIFKESVVNKFRYYAASKSFDNDYLLYLDITLSPKDYDSEKQRISEIRTEYNDEVNEIIYSSTAFKYPAFITSYNHNYTNEYALLDDENNRIIYVFSQFEGADEYLIQENLWINNKVSLYKTNSLSSNNGYSVYYFPIGKDTLTKPELTELLK